MPKVNEIRTALFEAAPEYMKMEWDNVGLMCGHAAQEVTRVLVALDASYRVLNEAQAAHCELVVCHHPLIFGGTKTVTDETPVGRSLLFAIENGISVLSFHTNLDCAPEGVNDVLARSLGLSEVTVMEPAGTDEHGRAYGLIRTGTVPETDVRSFAAQVKQALGCEGLRYAQAKGLDGRKLLGALATGAAGSKQMDALGGKILAGDHAPGFFLKHFVKDMRLAAEEAEHHGLLLEMLPQVLKIYEELEKNGKGEWGTQGLINRYHV